MDVALARKCSKESARVKGLHTVSLFVDINGFYDSVSWQRLCEQGLRLSFPALALCLSLRLYQGGRTVVGESQPSPTIFPGRGMIQGCPYAPTLAKLTMSEPLHRLKRVTGLHHCDVWLDDVSADSLHASPDIAAGAAYEAFRVLKASLQAEGLVLSQEKTKFVAGTPRSAAALRQLLRPGDPDIVDVVKDLGLDSGSGRRRRTTTAQKRFRVGSLRNLKLGKLRIPSRRVRLRLHRSSVVTSGLYGHEAQGVAPKHMKTMRAAVARHAGRSRYGSTDTILDMTAHEVQDPYLIVVTQHVESLFRMMARCNRMGWEAVKDTWRVVWKRLEAAKHGWSVVTGPISAMCQYLRDLQVDGHDPSRWVFEERVLEIKPSEVSVVCQTSSFLMDIIKTQRSRRIGSTSSAAGAAGGVDWTVPRRLLKSVRAKTTRYAYRAVFQGSILHNGNGGKDVCKFCGDPGATLRHLMYECPSFPGGMRLPGYVLAEKRRFPDDCLWLRGMLPLKYLPVAPSGDLEVVKTGVFLTSSQVVADGLVVATDASGGKFTKDPRLRRVSWSVVVGRVQDGLFQELGTMSGLTPPGTSVAHGESYAIVQTIKHTLGQVDLTGDCKPALKTLTKKSFQKTTPAFWGPVWEDRGRIRPTWVKSHLTSREFEIRFGFSQLWRHHTNQCADELAGKRAATIPPVAGRKVQDLDRLVTRICDYLASRAVVVLKHASKDDFVPRSQRQEPQPPKGPNKRQLLLAKVDVPEAVGGHVWQVGGLKTNNLAITCVKCKLYLQQVHEMDRLERLLAQPCIDMPHNGPQFWPTLHPTHRLKNEGRRWLCSGCHLTLLPGHSQPCLGLQKPCKKLHNNQTLSFHAQASVSTPPGRPDSPGSSSTLKEAASLPTAAESHVSKGSGKTKEVVSLPESSAREAGLAREPAPKPASRAKKKKELPTGQQTLCFKKQ